MDYISKRKNNMQSISIYYRPHQGLEKNWLSNHLQTPPQIRGVMETVGEGAPSGAGEVCLSHTVGQKASVQALEC